MRLSFFAPNSGVRLSLHIQYCYQCLPTKNSVRATLSFAKADFFEAGLGSDLLPC